MNSLFSLFNKYPNLVIALSEKKDGPMKLSSDSVLDEVITENHKKFLKKLGINVDFIASANLVHGTNIKVVTEKEAGGILPKADGLITKEKKLFLSITVADCLPIFLYDFEKEIVGLIHGGWRNLAQNILSLAIKKLSVEFGSQPENILAGIGPGISQCHFEVGEEVSEKFKEFLPETMIWRDGKKFLDLKKIAEIQLINLGFKKENIEINPDCTYCLPDKYFSYRRDKPKSPETMIAFIGMRQ